MSKKDSLEDLRRAAVEARERYVSAVLAANTANAPASTDKLDAEASENARQRMIARILAANTAAQKRGGK